MPGEGPAADDPDPQLVLTLELAQANAALALAHVEHAAVLKRLGTRAPPPTMLPREVPRPALGSGVYRGRDELVELQRAVDEARLAARTLRGQSSALESECDMQFAPPPFGASKPGLVVLTLASIAGIGGVLWLVNAIGGASSCAALPVVAVFAYLCVKLYVHVKSSEG